MLENSKNFQFGKFQEYQTWKFLVPNLKNSKNFQVEKFQKLSIWKIPRIVHLENSKNLHFKKFEIRNSDNF